MTFTVEVLLRDREAVVTDSMEVGDREPAVWTDDDVRHVLESMLQTIAHVKDPAGERRRPVSLRGLSWIVDTVAGGVMIAIEIPTGAVVAGPFAMAQERLDAMVARVIAAGGAPAARPTVH